MSNWTDDHYTGSSDYPWGLSDYPWGLTDLEPLLSWDDILQDEDEDEE